MKTFPRSGVLNLEAHTVNRERLRPFLKVLRRMRDAVVVIPVNIILG